jgi:hypothetical protein
MSWVLDGETFTNALECFIDESFIDLTLTNHTVLVPIELLPQAMVDVWRSTGGDIRAASADYTTRRALSVEQFNQGAYTGALAINVASINPLSRTKFILFGGNGSATQPVPSNAYGSENATNIKVVARLPLDEDPSGAGEVMLDTTANNNDGEPINMESGDSIVARINKGIRLDGVNEHVILDNHATLNYNYNENFTIQFAFRIPSGNQPDTGIPNNFFLAKWSSFATGYPYAVAFRNQTHTPAGERFKLFFTRYDLTNAPVVFSANAGYNDDQWHHVTCGKDGNTLYMKVDGEAMQSTTDTTTASTVNTADLRIGNSEVQTTWGKFDMDELYIHDDWVGEAHAKAVSANILLPEQFLTFGPMQGGFNPQAMIF